MKKWIKWVGGAIVLAGAALQLTNPPLTNPPVVAGHDVTAKNPPPPEIAAMLKRSCYNCHSCETEWPWYSHVAPLSWRIAADVEAGRGMMNFSEWPHDDPSRARKRWRHIADEVEAGEMPMRNYALVHHAARLTDEQRAQLVQWAKEAGGE